MLYKLPSRVVPLQYTLSLQTLALLLQDEATGRVSLTLQGSVVLAGKGGEGGGLSWAADSLKKGLKIKGRVAAVKDFGVFVQLDNSEVRGGLGFGQAWPT